MPAAEDEAEKGPGSSGAQRTTSGSQKSSIELYIVTLSSQLCSGSTLMGVKKYFNLFLSYRNHSVLETLEFYKHFGTFRGFGCSRETLSAFPPLIVKDFSLFCVYECFAYIYGCVSHVSVVSTEVSRGHLIPGNWS